MWESNSTDLDSRIPSGYGSNYICIQANVPDRRNGNSPHLPGSKQNLLRSLLLFGLLLLNISCIQTKKKKNKKTQITTLHFRASHIDHLIQIHFSTLCFLPHPKSDTSSVSADPLHFVLPPQLIPASELSRSLI